MTDVWEPPGYVPPQQQPRGCAGCLVSLVVALTSVAIIGSCIGYLALGYSPRAKAYWVDPNAVDLPAAGPKTPLGILQAALTAQSKALLGGDEQGWMSVVDPGNADLVARYTGQFRVLRGLHVTRWYQTVVPSRQPQQTTGTSPSQSPGQRTTDSSRGQRTASGAGQGRQTGTLSVLYCLGDVTCKPGAERGDSSDPAATMRSSITWTVADGKARVVDLAEARNVNERDSSPLRSDLVTAEGSRVVVAAPPSLASYLPKAITAGDAAAAAVDPLARYYPPPDRYVLYLAGKGEYGAWFRNAQPQSAGFTVASHHNPQMVINLEHGWLDQLPSVIRHEMGHVVTLQDTRGTDPLWLVEGTAEYIEHHGKTVAQSGVRPQARAYLKAGGWDGHVAIDFSTHKLNDDATEDSGRYALSYLGVRCMAESYGEDKLFALFATVVRKKEKELPAATLDAFGVPWETVDQRCSTDIRANVG